MVWFLKTNKADWFCLGNASELHGIKRTRTGRANYLLKRRVHIKKTPNGEERMSLLLFPSLFLEDATLRLWIMDDNDLQLDNVYQNDNLFVKIVKIFFPYEYIILGSESVNNLRRFAHEYIVSAHGEEEQDNVVECSDNAP